ncbi:hypothetical protein A6E13_04605 [Aliivibrio fischeri]|uniref:hypothetical protein n=1 Tax=Aliivibrio fischeri TaxID=668 RepID=UPI00080E5FC8|nr:hypothetical protein [Aliivibrio fischeri]OCH30487.1 hypothetical protein A6E13_04605 [Aliivibrio fischeri]
MVYKRKRLKIQKELLESQRNYELEVAKLYIDYAKYSSSLFTLCLGGQMTLFGTVFADANFKIYAIISMLLMTFAVLSSYSFSELELRRLRESEIKADLPSYLRIEKYFLNRTKLSLFKSVVTALFATTSIFMYLWFLFKVGVIDWNL